MLKRKRPVDFDQSQLRKLKKYFDQMDTDLSGEIDLKEIELPLISMNIYHTQEEVEEAFKTMDLDGNGTLEFDEF
jgi:Ca2+-binding EF-hand superfamily protein